ncbi:hypothetical protein OCAR_7376 [Afipia carboxidovorans OM5]|nr:hypothetical protein OCAR_7376 [Afipia carboxidovorans OM5]
MDGREKRPGSVKALSGWNGAANLYRLGRGRKPVRILLRAYPP